MIGTPATSSQPRRGSHNRRSPVDHGYLQVRNLRGEVFTVAMQEIDCGPLYEVSGWFLSPQDWRVQEGGAKQ